jgi:hypothetical protein
MKSIEITPDALALTAYIANAVRAGRDAEARETGGQLLELQPHFRVSQAQETFPIRYRSFKTE